MDKSVIASEKSTTGILSPDFVRILFRGAGQVMFQNNICTGLFFMVGIFVGAYLEGQFLVAWGALVGLIVSTLTAYFLPLSRDDNQHGLWGFNGILVGCAFMTFLGSTIFTWLALIVCAMLTTWVRQGLNNVMARWKINSLTFPFVFCTWIFLLSARMFHSIPPEYMSAPILTEQLSSQVDLSLQNIVIDWLKGVSQVFLINSWVTGLLFLIGLAISNKWAAIWAGIASAISLLMVILMEAPGGDIANGLYGFSAVLTGIALGTTFYKVNRRTAMWAVMGIVVTVFVQAGMNGLLLPFGLPSLTAPFCIVTWLFLLPKFDFDSGVDQHNHTQWHKKKLDE